MKQLNPKDKSMIARMAGNIVGPMLALGMADEARRGKPSGDVLETMAQMAVSQAIEILDAIEQRMPCGECEECKSDIRCREIPE